MIDELILASLSPFRAQMLKNAGLVFSVHGAAFDEREIENKIGEVNAHVLACELAKAKAEDVSKRFPFSLIIGCDQTLELDGQVLHKPFDMEDARRRLLALSGKTHFLHSGIALYKNGALVWSHVETANMKVRVLEPAFVGRYLTRAGTAALSSVGAYQVEGEGVQLFEKIEGDYFTVVGMPLLPLLNKLRQLGVIDG